MATLTTDGKCFTMEVGRSFSLWAPDYSLSTITEYDNTHP